MSSSIVALDLGSTSIHALEVQPKKDSFPTIIKAASYQLPSGVIEKGEIKSVEELAAGLKSFWKESKFKTQKVVLMSTGTTYDARPIDGLIGLMEPDVFKRNLPVLIKEKVPYNVDEYYMDSYTLNEYYDKNSTGKMSKHKTILAVGTKKKSTDILLEVLSKAKLIPIYLDILPLALLRGYHAETNETPVGAPIVSVDIGADIMTIIVHTNAQPEYTQAVQGLGGQAVTNRISKELHITEKEAEMLKVGLSVSPEEQKKLKDSIVYEDGASKVIMFTDFADDQKQAANLIISREVTKIISHISDILDDAWTNRNDPPYEIALTGGSSKLATLIQRCNAELGIRTRMLSPFEGMKEKKENKEMFLKAYKYSSLFGLTIGIEEV